MTPSCFVGGGSGSSVVLLSAVDLSATVPDGVRTVGIVAVAVLVLISAASVFVTQLVIPEEMAKLSMIVEKENPERWAEIQSKLKPGEKITDRQDLMTELTEVGISAMVTESEKEQKQLLSMIKEKKMSSGGGNDDGSDGGVLSLKEPIEASLGISIEEFVSRVNRNSKSDYLTETGKELAELLTEEFLLNENYTSSSSSSPPPSS